MKFKSALLEFRVILTDLLELNSDELSNNYLILKGIRNQVDLILQDKDKMETLGDSEISPMAMQSRKDLLREYAWSTCSFSSDDQTIM